MRKATRLQTAKNDKRKNGKMTTKWNKKIITKGTNFTAHLNKYLN